MQTWGQSRPMSSSAEGISRAISIPCRMAYNSGRRRCVSTYSRRGLQFSVERRTTSCLIKICWNAIWLFLLTLAAHPINFLMDRRLHAVMIYLTATNKLRINMKKIPVYFRNLIKSNFIPNLTLLAQISILVATVRMLI
jgi:hypothetical protein